MCGIVLFSWHKYTKVIRSTSLWNISCVTHWHQFFLFVIIMHKYMAS
jgi:hypothetical protein